MREREGEREGEEMREREGKGKRERGEERERGGKRKREGRMKVTGSNKHGNLLYFVSWYTVRHQSCNLSGRNSSLGICTTSLWVELGEELGRNRSMAESMSWERKKRSISEPA